MKNFWVVSCLLVVLTGLPPAYAQVDYATATLRGTVRDAGGAVVSGATVAVTGVVTRVSKVAKTGTDGFYQFQALPPGKYQIAIEAAGFKREAATGIELTAGNTKVFDLRLQLGQQDITLDGEPGDMEPLIRTDHSEQSNVINLSRIDGLPNLDRNITQAAYTLPGVSNSDAARSQQPGFTSFGSTGFSIGGGNGRNLLSSIDGGDNEYGTGQYRWTNPPLDAIQEYQVIRNAFGAEFGFTSGSAIKVLSKSGTSVFHGDLFGYFRDHSTSAANFFNGLAGRPKAYSQNMYAGGTLGGAIIKEKLFFFTAYEYQKQDSPALNFVLNAPTVLGIGAPGLGANCAAQFASQTPDQLCYINALKTSGNPFLVGFANGVTPGLSPLNNPSLNTILARDNGIFRNTLRRHNALVRFDAKPSDKDSLNLRLGYARSDTSTTYPDGNGLADRDVSILTSWTRAFNPKVVNEALVQIVPQNKTEARSNPFTGVNFSLGVLYPGGFNAPSSFNVGQVNPTGVSGVSTFGSSSMLPYTAHQRRYQFEDNVSWTNGTHSFKFGVSYRPATYNLENDLWFNNQFDFKDGAIGLISLAPAAVQAQLVGFNLAHGLPATGPTTTNLSAPQSFAFGVPLDVVAGFNNPKWSGSAHYFGGYVQDSWRLTKRLTMNAGLRLDYDGEPSPIGGSIYGNIYASPRLGFAWDPFGDEKTVIRAGGGIYVAPVDFLVPFYGSLLNGSGTYINEVYSALTPTNPKVAQLWGLGIAKGELPFGHLTPADFAAVGLNTTSPGATIGASVDPNYKNPYTVEASLSIARQIVTNMSMELGYNLYHGVHLTQPVETGYTEIAPGNPACPTVACTDPTGGPFYASVGGQVQHTTYRAGGSSIYHGMTASLTRRISDGLQFQVNYTWSKTIDNTIDFAGSQNWFRPSRPNLFRAVSAFDVPHILVASAVYKTQFKAEKTNFLHLVLADISLAPIVTVRSGLPFSVRTPTLPNGLALDNNFAMPFGASRDDNRGPGYATADFRITKAIFLHHDHDVRVDFTAEGTNIFNRVNFNKVNDQFDVNGVPPGGIVQTARGPFNLLAGPYTGLHGVKPTSSSQITQPLYYSSADAARQIQFGVKVAF